MTGPIIDVHTHLLPEFGAVTGAVGVVADDDGRLVIDGHRIGVPALYDAAGLTRFVKDNGLDAAWVSAPPPTYRSGLDAEDTDRWVRTLDAGMRARLAGHPTLGLLTYLPLDQPEVAHTLASQLLGDDSTVGWTASAGGGSMSLDAPALEPLWSVLERSGRPLLLHPGESPDVRLHPYYLANLLGNPVETGVAVAQLVLGGVLHAHPDLRVVLVHCGGIVPALVGRWARGVSTERPGIPTGTADPRQVVRSLWADTLGHSAAVLDLALSVFGPERLVLGSDYPFPMGLDDPLASIAHLDVDLRDRIARNAARLLSRSTS